MTDTLPPGMPDNDDPLVRRIVEAARMQDREVAVPDFDMVRENLAQRLAAFSENCDALPIREGMARVFSRQHRPARALGTQTLRYLLWSASAVAATALIIGLFGHKQPTAIGVTQTYTTLSGQQATFVLVDGTHVTLAPRTTLRLQHFGTLSRTVALEGQAYFEVTSSASSAPFLVSTGSIVTRVLGTAFLVRHYANDTQVHVAVAEGKVSLASTAPASRTPALPVVVTRGQISDVTDSTVFVNAVSDLKTETEWMRGQLTFRHVPVSDVLRTIGQWYGYQFRCSDSTMTRETVTLAVNARSSADALATLEQVLNVRMTIVGDTVTLTPEASQSLHEETRKQKMYDVWIPTREVGR